MDGSRLGAGLHLQHGEVLLVELAQLAVLHEEHQRAVRVLLLGQVHQQHTRQKVHALFIHRFNSAHCLPSPGSPSKPLVATVLTGTNSQGPCGCKVLLGGRRDRSKAYNGCHLAVPNLGVECRIGLQNIHQALYPLPIGKPAQQRPDFES